ncbi:MAG: F0F1 ATP synthase subunit beta, partial [Bacteroidales bacterium]
MSDNFGKITQVIGPVVDVAFEGEGNSVPPIYDALKIKRPGETDLMLEIEQHIGENTVRCVAMDSTDGLQRGMIAERVGTPIAVPVGEQVKGRLLNVIG